MNEIFIKYFERTISDDEMQKMFTQIGSDSNWMVEFKNYWMLDYAAKKCADSFSPPSYVVSNIYSKLGYSVPPGVTAAAQTRNSLFSKSNLWGNILSGVMGVILTLAVMLIFFYPNQDNALDIHSKSNYPASKNPVNQIPVVESKEKPSERHFLNHRNINKDFNNSDDREITDFNNGTQTEDKNLSLSPDIPSMGYNISNLNSTFSNLTTTPPDRRLVINYKGPIGFTIGFGNNPSWNILRETLPLHSVSPFNNFCISVLFDLSDNFKIGADARQETFYTEYTENGLKDSIVIFNQQSNLTTFSADARWYPYSFGPFNSFLGMNVGFNQGGIILRPGIGLEYLAYNDIGFVLGVDYSYFRYHHINKWFGNSKIGINYSVLIKF